VIFSLESITGAGAQQAPFMHFGADTRHIGPSECIRRAKADVRARGFNIDAITGDSTIVGAARTLLATGPNVVVIVNCVTLGLGADTRSNILVAAASSDGALAERIRNEVRIAVMGQGP
jgi:hypothetical protein